MVGNLITVNWTQKLLGFPPKAGWDIVGPGPFDSDEILLSWLKLQRVPRNLRDPNLTKRFDELIQHRTKFSSWWDGACGKSDEKFFVLNFPEKIWNIPWEVLIERAIFSGQHATVSLTRTAPNIKAPESPRVFNEPLRSLILLGDDGSNVGLRRINLQDEVSRIKSAWNNLNDSFKLCVEDPVPIDARRKDVKQSLRDLRPHVIWYSGHGVSSPQTELIFADGDRVSAKELAEIISDSGFSPLYAVFWACDTGGPESRTDTVQVTPALFNELSRVGILSILAMQAPIRDLSARIMAEELFRQLATGKSLEIALARTRALLMEMLRDVSQNGGVGNRVHALDWACPVIWSAGKPAANLQWCTEHQPAAAFQMAGLWALRIPLETPTALIEPPSAGESQLASAWSARPRTWVNGKIGDWENKVSWLRALQAIPKAKSSAFVFPILLDSVDPEEALQRWAKIVYERIRPKDMPWEIVEAIDLMRVLPYEGWKRICQIPHIYLGIANPPGYNSEEIFWKLLLNQPDLYVNIISSQEISLVIQSNWQVDKFEAHMDPAKIEAAIQQAPQLAYALAVLDRPLSSSLLYIQRESNIITTVDEWPGRDDVLVQTTSGPVVRAVARQLILGRLTEEERIQAHRDCVEILLRLGQGMSLPWREQLLDHFVGAKMLMESVTEAAYLCKKYYASERPFAAITVIEKLGEFRDRIPQDTRLYVAGSYLQLGMLERAQSLLWQSQPLSIADQAWKHSMQAEIYKSEGIHQHREKALDEIETAIGICEDALNSRQTRGKLREELSRKILLYRQERARILHYLFHERQPEAADEYDRLINDLSNRPDSELDLAAVKRNYSELIRKDTNRPPGLRNQHARELLSDAEMLARQYADTPILADILYEKVKIVESENPTEEDSRSEDARRYLEECIGIATSSNYFMLRSIARSRHFWKYEQFAVTRWEEIETELSRFSHGFALRVLIDGRLRYAKRCDNEGDSATSIRKLKNCMDELLQNPSFDQGSDKLRIIRTYAGLSVLSGKMNGDFEDQAKFVQVYPWFSEWVSGKSIKDFEWIWEEVS